MASVVAMKVLGTVMYRIALVDAGGHEGKPQGIGAAADPDTVIGAAEAGEVRLEGLHHGPANEGGGCESVPEDGSELLFQLPVGRYQIEKGNVG